MSLLKLKALFKMKTKFYVNVASGHGANNIEKIKKKDYGVALTTFSYLTLQ